MRLRCVAGLSLLLCLVLPLGCAPWEPRANAQGAAAPSRRYQVVDLGVAEGREESMATAINHRGQVLVISYDPGFEGALTVIWEDGRGTPLAAPPGYRDPAGFALNEAGQVAGNVRRTIDNLGYTVACRWTTGRPQVAAGLGGRSMNAIGIAADGTAVGWGTGGGRTVHAFRWNGDELELLAFTERWTGATARDLNDAGQIVGYTDVGDGTAQAALWRNGTLVSLATPDGQGSMARAINRAGDIVGVAWQDDTPLRMRAVRWREGRLEELGTLGGGTSEAAALNNSGQVVGYSETAEQRETGLGPIPVWHAFLWTDGRLLNLNDLIPADSGWELQRATGINDHGWIVGEGIYEGQTRAFLLKPE